MRFSVSRTLTTALFAATLFAAPLAAHADDHGGDQRDHGGDQRDFHGGGDRGAYDHQGNDHRDYNQGGEDHRGGGNDLGGALLGLGIGALVGGVIVSQQQPYAAPPPAYYAPPPPVYYNPPPPAYYAPPPGAYYDGQ